MKGKRYTTEVKIRILLEANQGAKRIKIFQLSFSGQLDILRRDTPITLNIHIPHKSRVNGG